MTASSPEGAYAAIQAELAKHLAPDLVVVRELGVGGMGRVYLAREPALARTVAIKALAPEAASDEAAVARFRREAQSVASLSHPNVLAVHAVGELPSGAPYFVMQFVQGRNLQERVAEDGPLDALEARRVLGEVASALAAAHARGIVHRDVKGANVLLDDATGSALVADFGIAAIEPGHELEPDARLTTTGMFVGSPKYMSPEQLAGDDVGTESDVYSFGLLMYEVLAGRGPFAGDSPKALMIAHLRDDPPPLSDLVPDVDPELEALAVACLAKDQSARPSAQQIAMRLGAGGGTLLEWPPPGLEHLLGKVQRVAVEVGVGASLLMLVGLVGVIVQGVEAIAEVAFGFWMLAAAMALLFAVLLSGRLLLLGLHCLRARRYGYGLYTLLEVFSDVRGDTGALICGSREYATLSHDRRRRLRIGRVLKAFSLLLAAASPVLAGLATLRVAAGASVAGDPRTLGEFWWVFPLVLVAGLLPAQLLSDREVRAVRRHRKQFQTRRERRGDITRLAGAWSNSYASTAERQGIPPGPRGRGAVLGLLTLGGGLGLLTLVGVVFPLGVAAPAAGVMTVQPGFNANTLSRTRLVRIGRGEAHVPDSTLTALEAGRIAYELGALGLWSIRHPWVRPDLDTPQGVLFPGRFEAPFSRSWPGLLDSLYTEADAGFSVDQFEYLNSIAAYPGRSEFARLARAPGLDEWGYLLADSLPPYPFYPSLSTFGFDIPTQGLRDLGWSHHASAALAVGEGDFDQAEDEVRKTLSVGVLLLDHGASRSMVEVGSRMLQDGIRALEKIAVLRGDPTRALELSEARASALTDSPDWVTGLGRSSTTFWASAREMVADPDSPRAYRWEVLVWSRLMAQCGGVAPTLWNGVSIAGSLPAAEAEFRETESTRRMLDAWDRNMSLAGALEAEEAPLSARVFGALSRLSAVALGSDGIAFCSISPWSAQASFDGGLVN